MKVKVVTGYSEIPQIQVSKERFKEMGKRLLSCLPCAVEVFDDWPVEACWAYRYCCDRGVMPSANSIPADRFPDAWTMVLSNLIQNQKSEWVIQTAARDPEPDIFVWIDYGVFKQHNITEEAIWNFLNKVHQSGSMEEIVAPGLIDHPGLPIDMGEFCTRFCGSVVIIPRHLAETYNRQMQKMALNHMRHEGKLAWEVNYIAQLEKMSPNLKIRQYKAWWDASQFNNY